MVWSFGGLEQLPNGIGRELYREQRLFREIWDRFEIELAERALPSLKDLLWTRGGSLTQNDAVLGLYGWQIIQGRFLQALGIPCDRIYADGAGELAAAVHAGILDTHAILALLANTNPNLEISPREPLCEYTSSSTARLFTIEALRELLALPIANESRHPTIDVQGNAVIEFSPSGFPFRNTSIPQLYLLANDTRDEYKSFCNLLARLDVYGIDLNWRRFYGPNIERVSLPTYPFERKSYWFSKRELAARTLGPAVDQIHPLLHRHYDLAGKEIVFETDLAQLPYLSDHKVENAAVFPLAGYLVMALAAGKQITNTPLAVEDVQILSPIKIAAGQECLVQMVLQPEQTGYIGTINWRSAEGWVRHASLKLRSTESLAPDAAAVELPKELNTNAAAAAIVGHYDRCRQLGLDYGPAFQTIKHLIAKDNQSWAIVGVNGQTLGDCEGIHPAILDGCLQAIASALPASLASAVVPVRLKHFRLHQGVETQAELYCHVHTIAEAGTGYEVSLDVYNRARQLVLEILDLQLQPLARSPLGYYRMQWLNQIREAERPPEFIPAPSELSARLKPEYLKTYDVQKVDAHSFALEQLEAVTSDLVVGSLAELGLDLTPGHVFSLAEALQAGAVVKSQEALFGRLLEMLVEAGKLTQTGDGFRVETFMDSVDTPLIPERPEVESLLFRRCLEHLPDVLQGKRDPLTLLFPTDENISASLLYTQSVGATALNRLLAEGIAQILAELPEGRGLSILEIGAGTAATTQSVLERCGTERISYHFTDVSPHFFSAAKSRLGAEAIHRFAVLDIERPPAEQGFELGRFDIIIAANVLHATSDLRRSLRHVRELLKPNGALLLIEGTRPVRWLDVIFGMMSGWWAFRDHQLRPNYPLISADLWKTILQKEGFEEPQSLSPLSECCPLDPANSLILAKASHNEPAADVEPQPAKSWLVLGDEEAAQSVHQTLQNRGQRSRLVHWCSHHSPDTCRERGPHGLSCFAREYPGESQSELLPNLIVVWPTIATGALDVPDASLAGCKHLLELVKAIPQTPAGHSPPRLVFLCAGFKRWKTARQLRRFPSRRCWASCDLWLSNNRLGTFKPST